MLYALPLVFALIGLALYGVLGGADFGAGFWQLTAGGGKHGERIREHAHKSMAPVWEANHVWLIFVLTVVWTAYPKAFGSIASTLCVALLIAAVGIIFRGAAYALRSGASSLAEQSTIDTAFGISSVIVARSEAPVGILTERDCVTMLADGTDCAATAVATSWKPCRLWISPCGTSLANSWMRRCTHCWAGHSGRTCRRMPQAYRAPVSRIASPLHCALWRRVTRP